MTTPLSRSYLRHLQFSRDSIKSLHKHTKCRRHWWHWIVCCLRLNNSRNLQLGCPILLIPLTEVVGCVSPRWLCQFVKLHLRLPKMLPEILYCFRDFAYHPAGLVIIAQLAPLRIFLVIILIFPILPIMPSSELARSLRLSPKAFNNSSHVVSGLVVINPTFSAFLISSCSYFIAVSESSTRFLATAVSLST